MTNHQQHIDQCLAEIWDIILNTNWNELDLQKYLESKKISEKDYAAAIYGMNLVRKLRAKLEKHKLDD